MKGVGVEGKNKISTKSRQTPHTVLEKLPPKPTPTPLKYNSEKLQETEGRTNGSL